MTSSSVRLAVAVLATIGLAGGCTRATWPVIVPINGVVTLDGKPLSSGVVQFQPAVGQPATGEIGDDGSFTLSRYVPGDGVPPGTYRVAVVSYDPTAETQVPENLQVPLRYTRFGSSGIEYTVFPGTKDPLVISLVSTDEPPTSDSLQDEDRRGGAHGTADTSASHTE